MAINNTGYRDGSDLKNLYNSFGCHVLHALRFWQSGINHPRFLSPRLTPSHFCEIFHNVLLGVLLKVRFLSRIAALINKTIRLAFSKT